MERSGPDQKVFEVDDDSLGRLLALDPTGKLGNFEGHRIHDQIVKDALREDAGCPILCTVSSCEGGRPLPPK